MRFTSLGSGSLGNAHLIETSQVRVLIDCGFAAKEIEHRLAMLGIGADTLDAILVTHEHTDHVRGLGPLARRYRLPSWMTCGTYQGARCGELPELHILDSHAGCFFIGNLKICPYPVPHDSREPCQFVFQADGTRLGLLTDVGHITAHILASLAGCDSLILEFNHDSRMLAAGPYPPRLQARVGGSHGHLNNHQAVELLARLDNHRLQYLVAAHLSEKNNSPQLVRESLMATHPQLLERLSFAHQHRAGDWRSLTHS